MSIHIDGYKVSNPISFQGRDVAADLKMVAPMYIGALEKVATSCTGFGACGCRAICGE